MFHPGKELKPAPLGSRRAGSWRPTVAPAQSLGNDLLTLMTDLPCIIR
jgi:hypothetical protein